MSYKLKYIKYKKKYFKLKKQLGGVELLKLQTPCVQLSREKNFEECDKRQDCYIKKIREPRPGLPSRPRTLCAPKNLSLDLQQVQNLFIQQTDLCWFHTAISCLFFSDFFRDAIWHKCFYLTLHNDQFIPIATKFNNVKDHASHFWYLLIDQIRNVLIHMYKNISQETLLLPKGKFPLHRSDSSEYAIESCNMLFQETLCKVSEANKFAFCDTGINGGLSLDFTKDFLKFLKLHEKVHFTIIIKDNYNTWVHFKTEDFKEALHRMEVNNEIFQIVYKIPDVGSHIVSFFKFNNQWCFFDNETHGSIINLEIKTDYVERDLLDTKGIIHLSDLLKPIKIKNKPIKKNNLITNFSYSIDFNIDDIIEIYVIEAEEVGREHVQDIVHNPGIFVAPRDWEPNKELFKNNFYKYLNGILRTENIEVIYKAMKHLEDYSGGILYLYFQDEEPPEELIKALVNAIDYAKEGKLKETIESFVPLKKYSSRYSPFYRFLDNLK